MMNELEASDLLVELGQSLKKRVSEDSKEIGDGLDFCEFNRKIRVKKCYTDDTMSETEWKSARLSSSHSDDIGSLNDALRVQQLEEEQERLNNSLFSLSSHFAQVQFRIKQMNEADPSDREILLAELQNFAFKGCTDMNELQRLRSESESGNEVLEKQNERQKELLKQLRDQVEDLERTAYENGEGSLPSTDILKKQKAVLDKLQEKIELNLDIDKMNQTEIQRQVDDALKQLVNPFKEKEQLVDQLQTQITDLERFVNFLQKENAENSNQTTPVRSMGSTPLSGAKAKNTSFLSGIIGCSTGRFQKNQLKNTLKGNHYGDERAHVQLAVDATQQILEKYTLLTFDSAAKGQLEEVQEDENDEVFERSEEEVVTVVRKQLCPALKALLEHGMLPETIVHKRIPGLGCFVAKTTADEKSTSLNHIWDVILYFYNMKTGRDTTDAPVRKLSQSFKLDHVGGRSVTSKQMLLTRIENIISTHARLKRSKDAHWKAFVSAAMNENKLPAWLRIIFRTRQVVEMCYNSWSYVARTGCEELYTLLEGLHKYSIHLPVDLALRPFEQIKDAF
uniref:RUN domain-containing protein n=1 Tax=Caenorhabditis tropicalis TaxID=1561998 RepID=A0A1I7U7J6_9PELO